MGLGLLGRGIGDAVFFAEAGAKLTVTDLKTEKELAVSLESLKKFKNIKYSLGGHKLEDFQTADMVVKAAGVPMDSPFILEAQKNNVPVIMSTTLFAEYTPAKIIGITGTRGKSTVAYLLYEILSEHVDKNSGRKVLLGGNVLGVSTLELLRKTSAGDIAVLELDSWQLQGFGDSHNAEFPKKPQGFSPSIAVFTTFMTDHMNYYQNNMKRYFEDKANIYRFQDRDDILIVSEQVANYIKKFGPEPKSKMIIANTDDIPDSWKLKIIGEHNRLNVALAMRVALAIGVPEKTIKRVVENFKAVPGRLEIIRISKGVEFYNDTNSTTPEATIAGLKALATKYTVLIFGGANKELSPDELLKILPDYVKALVILPGTGTDLMKSKLETMATGAKIPFIFVKTMQEAVEEAVKLSESGDKILMSPAFASFGIFKNEYDRGDQFNACIKALK